MELDLLLEQHAEITKKIQHSLESVKHWFERKIEEVRGIFNEAKEKVMSKFSNDRKQDLKGKYVKDDIEDKNGNRIAQKGEKADFVFDRLKQSIHRLLSKLKSQCDKVVSDCQRALRRIAGISDAQLAERNLIIIEEHKKSVLQEINDTASTVALIANVISSVATLTYTAVKARKIIKQINNDREKYRANTAHQSEEDAIEVEFSAI